MLVSRIIEMSLKQLGVLAAGESVQGNELADALITLEGLLSQWATKRLYIHKVEQITLNLNGSAKVSPNNTDAPDYKTSISGVDQGKAALNAINKGLVPHVSIKF